MSSILERIPPDSTWAGLPPARRYATVPRCWLGSTIVVVACGPSLTQDDVEACRGRARVIAVNAAAIHRAPWADVRYAHHAETWDDEQGLPDFRGLKYSGEWTRWPDVGALRMVAPTGLELDPSGLRHGGTSAYQAVNLAFHLGAKRIVLLGVDMQPGENGELHYYPDSYYPGRTHESLLVAYPFATWLSWFPTIAQPLADRGVDVVNCTRRTALTCFRRASLDEALS